MKTTEYLYDLDPQTFDHMLYPTAIEMKLAAASTLLAILREAPTKDLDRISAVAEAVRFNQYLIDERNSDV